MNNLFNPIILALGLVALLWSCQAKAPETPTSREEPAIPQLLDRHASLRQGTEWDQIQRLYVAQQQALRKNPQDGEAYLKLAQIFINEARITGEHGHYYPAALTVANAGLEQAQGKEDLRFRLLAAKASVQLSQHTFADALQTAQLAVTINPYNAQIYGALVDANVELGKYSEAVAMADKMVSIRHDLRSYSRVSYLREIHGDVPGAIEAMQMAVAAGFPGQEATCWAQLTLGQLYERYGEPDKARMQYALALEERPDYPFAMAHLAHLDFEAGDVAAAETQLKAAATIIPEVSFYIELAEIYKATGRTEALEATKQDILTMLKDDEQSGHQMGLEYASLYLKLYDSPQQALPYAQAAYDRRPNNIDVNRLLAQIYQQLGDADQAQKFAAVAGRTQSKHPDLLAITKHS